MYGYKYWDEAQKLLSIIYKEKRDKKYNLIEISEIESIDKDDLAILCLELLNHWLINRDFLGSK